MGDGEVLFARSQDRDPDLPQRRYRQLLHDLAPCDRRVQKAQRRQPTDVRAPRLGRFPRNPCAVPPSVAARRLLVVDDGPNGEGGHRHLRLVLVSADSRHLVLRPVRVGPQFSVRFLCADQQGAFRHRRGRVGVGHARRDSSRRSTARDDRCVGRIPGADPRRIARSAAVHRRTEHRLLARDASDVRLPDFLIGGAPRAGTTWLYRLLDRHPGVYMARPATPEPKFFPVGGLYQKGVDFYSRTWFADVGGGRLAGEKSTDYPVSAVAAARIARDLPSVKLVFVLRNPVDRAYSNYLWSRMNGLEVETFETALALEEQRERELPDRLRFTRPFSYFSRGLYADLLQPYLDRFPSDQRLILKFEDLVAAPERLATRLHGFLGVAERPADA